MKKQYLLTKEGIEELENEHQQLTAQRSAIADRIKTAREFGDLSENAEYSAARQEQERNESRIAELDNILKNAEVIKKPKKGDSVSVGSCVKLKSDKGKAKEYQVVGTVEADPLEGKISDESPIGSSLLGKSVGQKIDISTPNETVTYKIIEIC